MERRGLTIPVSPMSTTLAVAVDPTSDVLYVIDSGAIRVVGPSGDVGMVRTQKVCQLGAT
jgi:hypothetical protein